MRFILVLFVLFLAGCSCETASEYNARTDREAYAAAQKRYLVECYSPNKVYKNVKTRRDSVPTTEFMLEDGSKVKLPWHYAGNRCLFTEMPKEN